MLNVRHLEPHDLPAAVNIIEKLPDHFTPDVPEKVERDSAHGGWVLADGDDLVGFVVAERRSEAGAEILWMAVDPARRSQGAGTVLLGAVLEALAEDGVRVVEVKTLDDSADYEPYVASRAFWEHRGFVKVDTIDPLPGWPAGNPAAIYVAALHPTL